MKLLKKTIAFMLAFSMFAGAEPAYAEEDVQGGTTDSEEVITDAEEASEDPDDVMEAEEGETSGQQEEQEIPEKSEIIEDSFEEMRMSSGPNSSPTTARSISVNKEYTDNLSTSSEIDYFKFSISSPGYINILFTNEYSKNEGWDGVLYDSGQTKIWSGTYGANKTTTKKSQSIGLPAGTYYYKISKGFWNYTSVNYKSIRRF